MESKMTDPTVPPNFYVTNTLAAWNINECAVSLGQGRQMILSEPNSPNVGMGYRVDWMAVVSMSPQVARMLRNQLNEFVENYEAKFGAIPVDREQAPIIKDGNVVHAFGAKPSGDTGFAVDQGLFLRAPDSPKPVVDAVVSGGAQPPVIDPDGGGHD